MILDYTIEGECWIFKGGKDKYGYGVIRIEGVAKKAHRISYEQAHPNFDSNLNVCHTCDNPSCINPNHLFAGNHSDNMKDMRKKKRGYSRGHAQITEDEIGFILTLREKGLTQTAVARILGISPGSVSNVERRFK